MSIGLLLLSNLFFGCAPGPFLVWTEDVTGKEDLWYGYRRGAIYKLKVDIFLKDRGVNNVTPDQIVMAAPRDKTKCIYTLAYSVPKSIEDYRHNRDDWHEIIGIVKAGTRIQCTRLVCYNTFGGGYGNSLYVFAKVVDGEFAGIEGEIGDISLLGPEVSAGFLIKPNLNLLSPVNANEVNTVR